MRPHKSARHALKTLHQSGTNSKAVKKIIPDIGAAIKKICEPKVDMLEIKKIPEICIHMKIC
jgi:hypothetical protein